ncbi:MAG: hypothetical protein ABSC17_11545 [Thermacetogeniaceae bacterium]
MLFNGSLYLQSLADGAEAELLRGTMLGQGYYGYFYSTWVAGIEK